MFHVFSLMNVYHLISVYTHFIISVLQSFPDYGIIVVINSNRYVHICQQISQSLCVHFDNNGSDGCFALPDKHFLYHLNIVQMSASIL